MLSLRQSIIIRSFTVPERIDAMRAELIEFFEKEIRPLVVEENKDNEEMFYDILGNTKFKTDGIMPTRYKFIVRWYVDTLRVSAYNSASNIQFFMTATIPEKTPYEFVGPAPAINER